MKRSKKKVEKLLGLAKGKKRALVIPHDYADPDAIAAALGINVLFDRRAKVKSDISFNGDVGRSENRALCDYLELEIIPSIRIDYNDYDLIILVDCQPQTGNNSLPETVQADVVIDHHPEEGDLEGVQFLDIRADCGSSSTMVTNYLIQSGIRIDCKLATALAYGIKSDAMNFARKTKERDIEAYLHLFPMVDSEMLSRIESADLPREYFRNLNDAIGGAGIYDNIVVSDLGSVDNPGLIGEFADMFLRTEGISSVICFGVYDEKLLISIRTLEPGVHAGKVIRYAVGKRGTAGGHAMMAGGQIPLLTERKKEEADHKKAVMDRIFQCFGIEEGKRKRKFN